MYRRYYVGIVVLNVKTRILIVFVLFKSIILQILGEENITEDTKMPTRSEGTRAGVRRDWNLSAPSDAVRCHSIPRKRPSAEPTLTTLIRPQTAKWKQSPRSISLYAFRGWIAARQKPLTKGIRLAFCNLTPSFFGVYVDTYQKPFGKHGRKYD